MIVEFKVGNYRSFKEIVTFSMVASNISSRNKKLDENATFLVDEKLTLLKCAAIYGANASGKSNLIYAIDFMRNLIRNSSRESQVEEPIDVEPFRLSEDTVDKPSFFQMVFVLAGKRYRYGFEVNQKRIVSEWLFHVPTTRESRLFVRDENGISISSVFKEGKGIEDKTRPNALFLSVVAQFNGELSKKILAWFKMLRTYSGIYARRNYGYTAALLQSPKHREGVLQLIKALDLDFDSLEVSKIPIPLPTLKANADEEMPEELKAVMGKLVDIAQELTNLMPEDGPNYKTIKTSHQKYDSKGRPIAYEVFDLHLHESEGTKKLVALAGSLVDVLKHGKVFIIDELDRSLHPLITCAIIQLFNSNETNPQNAQLIFATHDTNLLSNKIFRRDQIWFTEKDRYGATHLYSLVEYRIRNDASFESDYILGKYGAIPFIGDLRRLIGEPSV